MTLYIRHIISHMGTATHPLRRTLALLLLIMTLGAGSVWAQTDFTGIWYIANETNHSNAQISKHWYLVPGANPQQSHYADAYFNNQYCNISGSGDYTGNNYGDPEKPFLTTYQTSQDLNSMWIVVSTGDGYYNIIHAKTGYYVVYEPPYKDATHRKSMHLESTNAPGDNAKFTIAGSISGPININPKNVTSGNRYFNPAVGVGNRAQYYGTGTYFHEGMIGLWSDSGDKSQWYFEDASSVAALTPVISDVSAENTFTITSPAAAFSTIRYTTDGSTTPDANTGTIATSGSDITVTDSWTVQAVGVFGTFVTPMAGPKALSPSRCGTPIISYNDETSMVSISCATASTTIYYTTDNSTPTTSSTVYSQPFLVTGPTTIKAIATRTNFPDSEVGILTISQVATPTIQNNGNNAISITSATPGAIIYYTTDGGTPTKSSNLYTAPLQDNVSGVTIKAIAVKENMITSAVGSGSVTLQCAAPVIARLSNSSFTITCSLPSTGVTIYYTTNGNTPTTSSSNTTSGATISCALPATIKAFAVASNYDNSAVTTIYLTQGMSGDGSANTPYIIGYQSDVDDFIEKVNTAAEASKHYKVIATGTLDFSSAAAITQSFSGTFDGGNCILTGLSHPLFNTVNGGTVKNVMLDNVDISGGTNVGAICNEALGASRIYNCGILATDSEVKTNEDGYTEITLCSSTISGSNYVGGLVGLLDGSSRVINCFSYANITGGSFVGGIVGYNNVATTSTNLQTMVMNCMFYGNITGGNSKAPIYNGTIITNDGDADGVNNYNYFWSGASYVQDQRINVYNCALAAETRFLQRFEFFRPLLNSNRALAAWWATGDYDNKDEMLKWVMEPSQIGTSTPYPILKTFSKYPSVVNIDVNHSEPGSVIVGPKVNKKLTVNINSSSNAPSGAGLTKNSLSLEIIDKDPEHFNFNYYKVQLPYYNDVGTGNYTKNKVVTGWKIVSMEGNGIGTHSFSTGSNPADASASVDNATGEITLTTPYNYADRKSTQKDLYDSNGNRIFNQGAYFDVPEGVTSITIEPYWAKCVYVSDEYVDVVYKNGTGGDANDAMYASSNVTSTGGGSHYTNNTTYSINDDDQIVYTTMSAAVTALNASGTVYDNAIVLVGNVHNIGLTSSSKNAPYTIMSIDLDGDNEPDYSYILRFNGRIRLHPVRVDFLNVIGLGMAQKSNGGTGTYNFGIMQPLGWFEVTNTALFRVTQFEYDLYDTNGLTRDNSPMILHGGVIEQWVTVGGRETRFKEAKSITYYHLGSNVWFKEFHIGVHQDKTQDEFVSPHPPISVTGGDFDEFYLTGLYSTPNANYDDNAECYINGGRFGKVAGTAMQGIGSATNHTNGNIIWQIDNADIDEFYAGGINAAHIAEGSIYTVITNSRVDQFCGGPKFGDMNSDKKVVTNATNCTFRTFFGAGYGGNAYNRRYPLNKDNVINLTGNNDWNAWVSGSDGLQYRYESNYSGVEARIDYQFIPRSNNTANVARLFVDYVSFSLATTYDVTSRLTNCTITTSKLGRLDLFEQCLGNFYGGGSLGKVAGPIKSTLINCTIEGNVFGAGYSATLPKVKVMNNHFQSQPYYDQNLGAYLDAELPSSESYDWEHAETVNSTETAINAGSRKLYTTVNLEKSNLGSVSGAVNLTITTTQDGVSVIGTTGDNKKGHVYGGGDESFVSNIATPAQASTTVTISGNTEIKGNVFGGGNRGDVSGSTTVNIQQ